MKADSDARGLGSWLGNADLIANVERWHYQISHGRYATFSELKAAFLNLDFVGDRLVFNLGGYRLIAGFNFQTYVDTWRLHEERLVIEMIATDEYADLLQRYRPAVPQNPDEHSRLVAVLEDLELSVRILNPEEVQFADLVSALVLHYENLVCPMREVPTLEMLRHLVETRGLRQSDFVPVPGSITRGVAEKLGLRDRLTYKRC